MSRVVVVKLAADVKGTPLGSEQYRWMISSGLRTLSAEENLKLAVRKYLPSGVVGMKTSCLARKANSTPVALTEALSQLLIEAGFEANNLIVWERTSRELTAAGYTLNAAATGRRCLGTDANGVGYSESFSCSGDVNSMVSRILTDMIDHNVNLPVLKDHSIAGLSAGMKNMYGAIHNPNKYHDNNCDPFCAHVSSLEPLRQKNRLTIIDAIRVQYDGGPGFVSRYLADYNGLVISDDPVAADTVGLQILEGIRKDNGRPSLEEAGRPARYLKTAEQLGLGTADVSRIDLKVLTVDRNGRASDGEIF